MSRDCEASEPLGGGLANAGSVVRIGDVVRRPAPPQSASIHPLLGHLVACGFAAPGPRAIRGDGFEDVDFVPGDVAISPYPAWANDDASLASVGRLLHRYHDVVADFGAPGASWSNELADPEGGPIVCHNDVCLENVVFREGQAAGLIDFDFAAPGRPIWDVVHAARYWVPLTDPKVAAPSRGGLLDVPARLRLFVDAYGLDQRQRAAFPDVLVQAEEVAFRFFTGRVERGDPAFVAAWDTEAEKRYDRKMAWLRRHLSTLAHALGPI